uniref:Ciliary neurotrophic factor receptor n=1 Tax=Rousettus aegyptiacus TaxID=9407 RepID=A0A7J8IGL0_ROUAE|nr:ciliary neurotrophic factor receptor [Rousettus aegyptiacus]
MGNFARKLGGGGAGEEGPHVQARQGVGRGGCRGKQSAGRRWPVRIVLASLFSLILQQRPQGLGKFRSWAGGRSDPRAPGGSFLLPQKSGLQRAQGCERTRLPIWLLLSHGPAVLSLLPLLPLSTPRDTVRRRHPMCSMSAWVQM